MKYVQKKDTIVDAVRVPFPDDDDLTALDKWMEAQKLTYKLSTLGGIEIKDGGVTFFADPGTWIVADSTGPIRSIRVMFTHDFESMYREEFVHPPKYITDTDRYPASLTKENFFNELQAKYPVAMQEFCNWIDRYKGEVDWLVLFADHDYDPYLVNGVAKGERRQPKFHELPIGLQIGPIMLFIFEEVRSNGMMAKIEGPPSTILGVMSYIEAVMNLYNDYLTKQS